MGIGRRALASLSAGSVCVALIVAGFAAAGEARQQNTKTRDKAQQQEADALEKAVAAVQAGQPPPSEVAVAVERADFFKAANGGTYVAFTATVDGKALSNPAVALMMRVVSRSATVAADADKRSGVRTAGAASERDEHGRAARDGLPAGVAYEDLDFTSVPPAEPGQPSRVSRAFQVPAGDYDLYFGLRERPAVDRRQKPKIAVCRQSFSVPDYAGHELATSSVVVASKMAALAQPLGADEQRANPYTIGLVQMVPKVGTKFATTDELNVYFQIYNEGLDPSGKPNVQIDYAFFRTQDDGEKKIAASVPASLNAATLPQFDATRHQLADSPTWPLTTLQPGSYRLELRVTDKISGKAVTKDVIFSVL